MKAEVQSGNGLGPNALGSLVTVSKQPLKRRKVRVEVEIPEALMGEFDLMMHELLAGQRTRLDTLAQEWGRLRRGTWRACKSS